MRRMKAKKSMRKMRRRSMKKAMKKSMRRRRAMRVSKFGKRRSVFSGKKVSTKGGLKRGDLKKNKAGKIVTKKASAKGKKNMGKTIGPWLDAVKKARKALGIKGFVAIKKGSAFYNKAKSFYKGGSPKK